MKNWEPEKLKAYLITVKGVVQSVGFRPTVFRLFKNHTGWVKNTKDGLKIYLETELDKNRIKQIILKNKPNNSHIHEIKITEFSIKRRAYERFFIKQTTDATGEVSIPPDLGTCDECVNELLNPSNRRYLHPFINCTNCGPRFSIITGTPYDRFRTTIKNFPMCDQCKQEFENPQARRFHAQPICCNCCGPTYFLVKNRRVLAKGIEAIKKLAFELEKGNIALVKGIGGYPLVCDAEK